MVCNSDNNKVQLFQLNGKIVGKFEKEGSNLGEFNSSGTVAVPSNGRIVVCEWNNQHRIQILELTLSVIIGLFSVKEFKINFNF